MSLPTATSRAHSAARRTRALGACAALVGAAGVGRRAQAQRSPDFVTQYRHDAWNADRGLPPGWVLAAAQTPDGYLWLGTLTGLVRFDGVRFVPFDSLGAGPLPRGLTETKLVDRRGRLWVGTAAGVLARIASTAGVPRVVTFDSTRGAKPGSTKSLYEDAAGVLWAAGPAGILYRLTDGPRGERFVPVDLPSPGIHAPMMVVRGDGSGALWIGTRGAGLYCWRPGGGPNALTHFGRADGLPNATVWSLARGNGDTLWVGTDSGLVRRADGRFALLRDSAAPPGRLAVLSLEVSREGAVWAGTESHGLARVRGGTYEAVRERDGLSNDVVFGVTQDREGNVWAATRDGLDRFHPPLFTSIGRAEGLTTDTPGALVVDSAGTLWVAPIEGGLVRYAGGRGENVARGALRGDRVMSLAVRRAGGLWAGRFAGGLTLVDGPRTRIYTTADGLAGGGVFAVLEARDGTLWAGARGGLSRLDGGRFRTWTAKDGLPGDAVVALAESPDGTLWVGTQRGVARYANGRFTAYRKADGVPDDAIYALHAGADGAVWVGTGAGLARVADGRVTAFGAQYRLPETTLAGVVEDAAGDLWLSYATGLFRVRTRDLLAAAGGGARGARPAGLAVAAYTKLDGLRSAEGVMTAKPAAVRARDGRLWFATGRGVATLDPAAVPPPPTPRAQVEQVAVDGHAVPRTDSVTIGRRSHRFAVRYTGLGAGLPERLQFRYRLAGFDPEWIVGGAGREASYTDLPAGWYQFQVDTRDGIDAWRRAGAPVVVHVLPAFYRMPWFAAVCAAGTLALALVVMRVREHRLERRFALVLAERQRIARELHDTLLQGFTGVTLRMQAASRRLANAPAAGNAAADVATVLADAVQRANDALTEARQAVWGMRTATPAAPLTLARPGGLAGELRAAAERIVDGHPVALDVRLEGAPRPVGAPAEAALLHIGREAVSNAVRHAAARTIVLRLHFAGDGVRLSVRDDGRGFAPGPAGAGPGGRFGLVGMRERAADAGGRFGLRAAPGAGTEVDVWVPAAPGAAPGA